jgi:hypothetical protein
VFDIYSLATRSHEFKTSAWVDLFSVLRLFRVLIVLEKTERVYAKKSLILAILLFLNLFSVVILFAGIFQGLSII